MTEFDKLNLRVVPIEDPVKFKKLPNYNGRPLSWSDPSTWCSWEEREDVYPGVKEWYIIPPSRSTFIRDGIEIGYWVIDIDNHDGDDYAGAIKFLKECNLPPSLTVRTPSGGLHIYYFAPTDVMPAPLGKNKELKLPIEIKVTTGVVAPNGRDRVVIKDIPVAYYTIAEDNPISKIAGIKRKYSNVPKKETDPNFPIESEEFPDVVPGYRHATLISKAASLYARGCPPDKIEWWCKEFYNRTGRREQRNEIRNAIRDGMKFVDEGIASSDLSCLVQEIESPKEFNPLEGAGTLIGWEAVYAKSVFSDKEETKQYIRNELKAVPPADAPFVRGMLSTKTMRQTWDDAPVETQEKYEWFKDTLKMLLQK